MMKKSPIKFISKGDAFSSSGNSCAYIEKDKTLVIIDPGFSAFNSLVKLTDKFINKMKEHDEYDIIICITHLHGDHVGCLSTYVQYLNIVYGVCPVIYSSPEVSADILTLLKIQGALSDKVEIVNHDDPNERISIHLDSISIAYVKTEHVKNMPSCGFIFLVDDNGKSTTTYYTGDTNSIPEEVLELIRLNELDFLVSEIFMYKDIKTECHLTPERFIQNMESVFGNNKNKMLSNKCLVEFYHSDDRITSFETSRIYSIISLFQFNLTEEERMAEYILNDSRTNAIRNAPINTNDNDEKIKLIIWKKSNDIEEISIDKSLFDIFYGALALPNNPTQYEYYIHITIDDSKVLELKSSISPKSYIYKDYQPYLKESNLSEINRIKNDIEYIYISQPGPFDQYTIICCYKSKK